MPINNSGKGGQEERGRRLKGMSYMTRWMLFETEIRQRLSSMIVQEEGRKKKGYERQKKRYA